MRIVKYYDNDGWARFSKIRDSDPDDMAEFGIPVETVDISSLLDDCKKEIHNALAENGIMCYNDIVSKQNSVTSILVSAIRRRIVNAFKEVK
ncbi:MAG: hypothetical protein HPY87_08925 [Fervidobacterium sp.]|uniref:hypothetical protein n=1 Tax=Fervidobacterium sp. TaxID=1871331 RepID=UPI0025C07F9F|nr:hypothetical protein [Fervidobacterium sp.]NPU89983.1 hypothetical protein [Fervidobacterium sp.]